MPSKDVTGPLSWKYSRSCKSLQTFWCASPFRQVLLTSTVSAQTGSGLSGGVPALNKLKKLTYVDLSDNGFSGPLPTLPTQLWDIDLSDNELSGAIPASYGAPQL